MTLLDVESVRVFLAVAEFQSFTRAAETLGTTQGAISVKLKRLEDRLGKRLIERTPRQVRLSAPGEIFLEPAREFLAAHERAVASLSIPRCRFRLGIANHVMGPEIPALLARLRSLDPCLLVEIVLDESRSLLDGFETGTLDAIIIRSDEDRRGGEILGPESFAWYASRQFEHVPGEPLKVAATRPGCTIWDAAERLLNQQSLSWQEVFTGGTAAVAAALSAALAVAPFARRLAPPDLIEVGTMLGLPPLPTLSLVLHSSLSDLKTRETLRAITTAFREHRRSASAFACPAS
ncbi:LysR family transcriptional regulator [Dyella sp.]|uniref:LysR family transcriptional regulator n=1 Tax=Dyella sp. TaxID=1869338 RepID=UPI002ED1D1E6